MQLTAIEFASILRDLKCDARSDERRSNPRAPTRSMVQVIPVVPGLAAPVSQMIRARDISRNGIGLVTQQYMEENSRLLVLLPKSATDTFVLLCEVARVTNLPGEQYGIGVRMVRRVTDEERSAFMRGSADAVGALLNAVAAAA